MAFWSRIPRFWQNFIAGLLIVGLLLGFGQQPVVKKWEDSAVDYMISLNSSLARMTGENRGRPDLVFTMLDMDERSFRDEAWQEPYHVPRDKLLKLIQFAVEGKSSMIIVDVDLSKPGVDPQADAALKDYLIHYPVSGPPLILLRAKRTEPGESSHAIGEFRETILGDLEVANIHFAQPLFQRDTRDSVVRRWVLMEPGCYKGKGIALPSVQLLAYALLRDRLEGGHGNLADLDASLNANRPIGCESGDPRIAFRRPAVIGKTIFEYQSLGERLIYTIPWEKAGHAASDLKTVPAVFVTDRGLKDHTEVADRITLIGASYGASHDLHVTPLGLMPGSLIILNAVKSLSLFDQISQPPLYVRVGMMLAFVTLMSWVFSRYSNMLKLVILTALVVIFFVPISFWFFKYGVWFDFGIMMLAIKLQHSLSEGLDVRELKRFRRSVLEARQAGEGEVHVPGAAAPAANAGEKRLDVRLRRDDRGAYEISASSADAGQTQFTVAPDGVRKTADGYLLELKPRPKP